jgi:hypothetical protein
VTASHTQDGSQLDGLRHIGHSDYGFYNGADGNEFTPGTETLSIHHLAQLPIAGRGLLVDVDRYLRSKGSPLAHTEGQSVSLADRFSTTPGRRGRITGECDGFAMSVYEDVMHDAVNPVEVVDVSVCAAHSPWLTNVDPWLRPTSSTAPAVQQGW